MPADRAVDERDHAFGQPRELLGLEDSGPKVRPGTSSNACPAPVESRCSIDTSVTSVPECWSAPGRADVIAGEGERAYCRSSTDRSADCRIAVGDGQRAVHAEVALAEQPRSRAVAEQQRDIADGRLGAAEIAAAPPRRSCRSAGRRRIRSASSACRDASRGALKPNGCRSAARPRPSRCSGELPMPAVQHRAVESRGGPHRAARPASR